MAAQDRTGVAPATLRRAIAASALGNCVEWYDYAVYSYVVPIISVVFFPSENPTAGILSTFAVLAVSFVVRPFGGFVFGPLGDRVGRQRVLALTIMLMSGATFLIGVLPGYSAIGVGAPVLLVVIRLVQGFSTGGEYGGAATFMAEYAPDRRRGFLGSWLEFGTLTGYSIGATLVTVLTLLLPRPAMLAWGWRIPFLVALLLGVVGVYLRLRLDDTPVFKELEEKRQVSASPLGEVFRTALRPLLLCIGIVLLLNVADYTLLTYMPTYLSQVMHIGDTASLFIIVFVQLAMMAVLPGVGALSDRVGRKPVLLTCALGFVVVSGPAFLLISLGQVLPASIGLLLLGLCLVLILGTEPATLPALFPAPTRYAGMAIGYNLSTSAFGGTAPLVITFLIAVTHNDFVPAFYLIAAGLIAIGPILAIPETARASIRGRAVPGTSAAGPLAEPAGN